MSITGHWECKYASRYMLIAAQETTPLKAKSVGILEAREIIHVESAVSVARNSLRKRR